MVLMSETRQFSFQGQELCNKLLEVIQSNASGYWQHQFARLSGRETSFYWYLGVANGQIVHSGSTPWSSAVLLRLVQRYIAQVRQEKIQEHFIQLQRAVEEQTITPADLFKQLIRLGIADEAQLKAASRLKILNDLDTYLLLGSGEAKFIREDAIIAQGTMLLGMNAQTLIHESMPSMNLVPKLNVQAFEKAELPQSQKERIQMLVQSGKTINQIAIGLARDGLDIATMMARLIKAGLVTLEKEQKSNSSVIMIIDDSPLVLKQFQHWVTALGYPVVACQNATTALSTILHVKPTSIFIDINMPGISGFELVKQIRQQPQIAATPLVILTGEQKLSNKWRAQWSGCNFLNKPLSNDDIGEFQAQLQDLLQRLVASPEIRS
jgi:CheY-like chemotaxis protein